MLQLSRLYINEIWNYKQYNNRHWLFSSVSNLKAPLPITLLIWYGPSYVLVKFSHWVPYRYPWLTRVLSLLFKSLQSNILITLILNIPMTTSHVDYCYVFDFINCISVCIQDSGFEIALISKSSPLATASLPQSKLYEEFSTFYN